MLQRFNRVRFVLPFLLLLPIATTSARADGPSATRSFFADRRWDAVTAAEAGLVGANLATDPDASLYANPALALAGPRLVRLSVNLSNPNRDDLVSTTTDYADANGFLSLGEAGVRLRLKGLGITAYYAQPHYEHQESRFVGIDPQTGEVTGDPFPRRNDFTSATRYGGIGVGLRLKNGLLLGAAGEGVFTSERYLSTPQVPAGFPADSFDVDRSGSALGGALGASYTFNGLVTLGASYHMAGSIDYDDGGTDDAPQVGLVGVKVGRTAGSQGYVGARFLAARDVDLAEVGGSPYAADARSEFSGGYAYLDPAGVWTFRIGGGLSSRPNDAALKLSRFGSALGFGSETVKGSVAYVRTSESREGGRGSSRDQFTLTLDVGL